MFVANTKPPNLHYRDSPQCVEPNTK